MVEQCLNIADGFNGIEKRRIESLGTGMLVCLQVPHTVAVEYTVDYDRHYFSAFRQGSERTRVTPRIGYHAL
jgi:hypothetical protein